MRYLSSINVKKRQHKEKIKMMIEEKTKERMLKVVWWKLA